MIQLALRSSIQAVPPSGAPRSARIDGRATAVTISSSPARKTPTPMTASNTYAERRSIAPSVGGASPSRPGTGGLPPCGSRNGRVACVHRDRLLSGEERDGRRTTGDGRPGGCYGADRARHGRHIGARPRARGGFGQGRCLRRDRGAGRRPGSGREGGARYRKRLADGHASFSPTSRNRPMSGSWPLRFSRRPHGSTSWCTVPAVYTRHRTLTADGLETMFATNQLAPFLLTNLLRDRLVASAPTRVLIVTAPASNKIDFDDLQGERGFRSLPRFGASKAADLFLTFEFARRLEGTGVTVNAVHPGLVRTDLMTGAPALLRWGVRLVSSPPEKAAAAIAPLLLAARVRGPERPLLQGRSRDRASDVHPGSRRGTAVVGSRCRPRRISARAARPDLRSPPQPVPSRTRPSSGR